ncbi:MAG: FtsW/RodA/SpoVE family cell cycle protein, partial [Lachnospiraceae bacterium]|nr:FtsW/RodA/SpoVE family cell cycle protein [Lachnospiraceae bacterium]
MEEYMKLLMEQIRCKKAHPYIREELQGHIEEQIADNLLQGMSKEEAERMAVKDMGSPVEAGVALDRIHRPQIAWGMIALMALISIMGIIIHQVINIQIARHPLTSEPIEEIAIGSYGFINYTIIGFAVMLLVYHIDYSVIARFAKVIAAAIIGIGVYASMVGNVVAGMLYSVRILGISISLYPLLLLYVPLYGAVIYQYHGMGYKALLKAIIWMLVPTMLAFYLPNLPLAMLLMVSMSFVLTVAVWHGWFQVARKRTIIILWGCEVGLPIIGLTGAYLFQLLAPYQIARLQAFLTNSGEANFVTSRLRENLRGSQLLGNSGLEWVGHLPNYNSDYIFSYIVSNYGILFGAVVCCALAVLVISIFNISFKQKNQLGMCMGCGCGTIIFLNIVMNVLENIGILPITQTFLPFFSTG